MEFFTMKLNIDDISFHVWSNADISDLDKKQNLINSESQNFFSVKN